MSDLPVTLTMYAILAAFSAVPFCLFFNFPPLVDFSKQLSGFFVVVVLCLPVIGRLKPKFFYSGTLPLYAIICGWCLLSLYLALGIVGFTFWKVLLVGLGGALCLVIAPTVRDIFGGCQVKSFLIAVLFGAGLFVSVFGLLRFYGLAKYIVPWLEVDGSRLLGPWGQPNLTALSILVALISLVSMFHNAGRRFFPAFVFCSLIFIYSGIMTGSRAWLVLFFGYLFLLLLSGIRGKDNDVGILKRFNRKVVGTLLVIFCLVYPVSGILDEYIASPLQKLGILDRNSASEMLKRHTDFSGRARIHEWTKVIYYPDLAENVWIGYGVGRYGVFSNEVTLLENAEGHNGKYWDNAHNILIMALVEGGVVGFIFVVAFLGLIAFLLLRNLLDGKSVYYCCLMAVLMAQNLVEFSFWYTPFLFLFLILVGLTFEARSFVFSSIWIPRFLCFVFFVTASASILLAVKDYVDITRYYYYSFYGTDNRDRRDDLTLDLAKGNIFIGYAAWETDILANQPPIQGWERQLKVVTDLWRWQPIQAFSLRRATLLSAIGDPAACEALSDTTMLYPDTFPKINEEIGYFRQILGDAYPEEKYVSCAVKGMAPWLNNS